MHWGHQVTKDMIKWEQLPFAIDGHKVLLVSPIENDDKESCQKVLTTFLVICYTPLYRKMTTIVVIWHM